jgi:hypothetical protein
MTTEAPSPALSRKTATEGQGEAQRKLRTKRLLNSFVESSANFPAVASILILHLRHKPPVIPRKMASRLLPNWRQNADRFPMEFQRKPNSYQIPVGIQPEARRPTEAERMAY